MTMIISLAILFGLVPNVNQFIPTSALVGISIAATPFLLLTPARVISANNKFMLVVASVFVFISLFYGLKSTEPEVLGPFVLKPIIFIFLFAVGCIAVEGLSKRQILFCLYFMTALVIGNIALLFLISGFGLYFQNYDPNFLSIALIATLLVGIKTGHRVITILSLLLVALTFSRMGALVAIALFVGNLKFNKLISLKNIMVLLLVFYFIFAAPDNILVAMQTIKLPSKITEADNLFIALFQSGRIELWADTLAVMAEQPFGVGPGQSPFFVGLDFYQAQSFFQSGAPGNLPHNTFLLFLVEYGVIFGSIQFGCLLYFIYFANRSKRLFFMPIVVGATALLDVYFQSPFWLLLLTARWLNVYLCHDEDRARATAPL